MGEVNLAIHGKAYSVACDDGQERRVAELGKYVDARLREIASAGAATNESHLLVLTTIVLADEVHELRESLRGMVPATSRQVQQRVSAKDERDIIEAIDHLAVRIDSVASRLQKIQ